ncbi:MAG TPA: hypothetical protein VE195_07380 [Acidobacteriaceae bacterium]|nr:hypothetical protein [Acidobacteriaceae bacterium]
MISFKFLPFVSRAALILLSFSTLGANSPQAEKASAGLAWQVRGAWQVEGTGAPIRVGDPIRAASLLQPADTAGDHSITILLPDGQHFLFECFTVADCARGFRVPSLIHKPDAFAVDMLARIRTVLAYKPYDFSNGDRKNDGSQAARDEAVAVLADNNRVQVNGRLGALPKGLYTYDLRPLNHAQPPQFHLTLEKTTRSIDLALPAPGLYDITISDAASTPRIDLFLAAIKPEQSPDFQAFHSANATMQKWNEDYAGWPIDDFLRAYLESLAQSGKAFPVAEAR